MAYKQSRALREFKVHIKGYRDVLAKADRQITEPIIRQYVISAAVFLGHGSFENFIKDLFDIFARCISTPGTESKKIPLDLRMFLVSQNLQLEKHYANYQASGDERRLLQGLGSMTKSPKKALLQDTDQTPAIAGSEILLTKSYPSAENLDRVFARIGISKIFHSTNAVLRADSALILKGFADKRTELAHNAVMPGTSAKDIRDELAKVEKFVTAIDRVIYKHVTDLIGQATWYSTAT